MLYLYKRAKKQINKMNNKSGITIISLVVTIVVLLILASVTINALISENGIIAQAIRAKYKHESATELEQIQLAVMDAYMKREGRLEEEALIESLEDYNFVVEQNLTTKNTNWLFKVGGRIYRIENKGSVKLVFDEDTFEIGPAQNIDNYGKLVDFESENGINEWRLFYQDDNYAYLIYDGLYNDSTGSINGYKPYKNGSYVGNIGKKLSPKIEKLFSENNKNSNILKTAYLLDTKLWGKTKKFEDINGIAIFAIGSPTIELFSESYNNASEVARTNNYFINIQPGNDGYKHFEASGYLSSTDRNGIYCKGIHYGQWWLASPYDRIYHNYRIIENGSSAYWTLGDVTGSISPSVRPIVCINKTDLVLKNNT